MKKIIFIGCLLLWVTSAFGEITFKKKKLDLNFKCFDDSKFSKQIGFKRFEWKANQTEYFVAAHFHNNDGYYGLPYSTVYEYENQNIDGRNYPYIYIYYNTLEGFEFDKKKHNILIKRFLYQLNDEKFVLKSIFISINQQEDYDSLATIIKLMDKEYDDQKFMAYLVPLTQMFLDVENNNLKNRLFSSVERCEKI